MAYIPSPVPADTPPGLGNWLDEQLRLIANQLGVLSKIRTGSSGAMDFHVDSLNIGDPGFESGSIQLDDASYSAVAKINEFGGSQDATLVLHRHDTTATVAPNLVFSKTKSETSSHANVADNEVLGRLVFAGYHTDGYWTGARIEARVNGTPGDGDMPTELRFLVSADGSNSPTESLRLGEDGRVYISQGLEAYADDSAAASGGVPVNGLYRTGSVIKIRVS